MKDGQVEYDTDGYGSPHYARSESDMSGRLQHEAGEPRAGRQLRPSGWLAAGTPTGPVRARWALLVGVNHFVDPAIPDLRYCVDDVLAMEEMLQARGYTTLALHDDAPSERLLPTRENVEAELARLCRAAGPDDLLWVHFACHGMLLDDGPVLVTRETREPTLAEKALPLSEVQRRMRASQARRLVLTLDACHTGVEIGRDLGDPEFIRNAYELAEGFALLAASSSQQVAQEWEEKEHGVFTYYLLEGLGGRADRDGKGFVTVDDLKTHVLDGLRRWNVEHGGLVQEPTARTEGLGDMIVVVLPRPGPDSEPFRPKDTKVSQQPDSQTVADYLDVVASQCGRVETRPYRQLSELRGVAPRFSLLDLDDQAGVYVPLRFDMRISLASAQLQERLAGRLEQTATSGWAGMLAEYLQDRQLGRELSFTASTLGEVLGPPGNVVLIGSAGCGKTTALRLVATVLAKQDPALARQELGWEQEDAPLPLPIFIALRDFEHACQTAPGVYRRDVEGLLKFLDDHFQRWHPDCVPQGFLSGLVRAGQGWVLLDALDEVADFDHRIAVRQVIEGLADAYPGNRFLVTARVAAYASVEARLDDRFHVAAVRDLTREQWAPIVQRLYGGLEADPGVAAERARLLLERIDGAPLLQEMVKTPLMVWTATLIHSADRELPDQRAELYGAYADVLLGERLHEEESAEAAQRLREDRWPQEDRRLYLTYAAYQVHEGAEERQRGSREAALVVVDERDLVRRILAPFMSEYLGLGEREARREAAGFLALMAERSGLLYAHEEGYSFGDHLTVQEFLAANYLVDNLRGTAGWKPFLEARAGQSWWREVFLLMAGYLLQWPQQARRFLLEELGALPGEGDELAYGLAWAGRALLEIPPQRVGWHAAARDELARRLVRVLWRNPPAASVSARLEAGDVLGLLGDLRFTGPCLLPEFMPIAGGQFWMGSGEDEAERLVRETGEEWFKNELPRHQVELDAYALARYPTTNAMYGCFMEASGLADERWWSEAREAGAWRPDGQVEDYFGDVRSQPAYWEEARLNGPNQPVVGVTWYEAAAYCRWLTAALDDGHLYRLPTEAEWERAARGPEGHRYPWGDGWQAGRANTKELNLERTTPAGIFPDGASAEGVLDLAGNVWEWCSSRHRDYPYRPDDGRENLEEPGGRVLRGGSWTSSPGHVRCAARINFSPAHWFINDGFRVARGPLK